MWDALFCYVPEAKSYVNPLKLLFCAEISYIKLAKNITFYFLNPVEKKKKKERVRRGILEGGGTLLIFCGNLSELFLKHADLCLWDVSKLLQSSAQSLVTIPISQFPSCAFQPASSSFERVNAGVTRRTTVVSLHGEWNDFYH